MGVVFGKQTVAEPAFELLLSKTTTTTVPYEIRRYGTRFAVETAYATKTTSATSSDGSSKDDTTTNDDGTPFRLLAQYIGVFGEPANEGQKAIAMTAPVMKQTTTTTTTNEPVKIAMTAPVIKTQGGGDSPATTTTPKTMAFVLPAEYDTRDKIPSPKDSRVHIVELQPQVGVVHRYAGGYSDDVSRDKALALAEQLRRDGISDMTDDYMLQHHQFWGYNPPFTIPMFRRNEIWVGLSEEQVNVLLKNNNQGTATN